MSELPETQKILDELSKSNSARSRGRISRQQQNARRRIGVVVVLFLLVVMGVLFLVYQQRSLQQGLESLSQENQQLNLTLSAQTTQLQQLQRDLAESPQPVPVDDSVVRQVEANFNAEIRQLQQQLVQLQSQQVTSTIEPDLDWKLLEAEYLLGMASHKLLLEADSRSAIALVESADAALLASGDNKVFAVRQAISAELLQLRNVESIDLEGLYLRIGNLATQLSSVQMLNSMGQNFANRRARESQAIEGGSSSTSGSATTGWLDASLGFLSSVFVWRKVEESSAVMSAPGSENIIRQNLRLMLEQAQLALLMRDRELYRRSLEKSTEWTRRYVSTDTLAGQLVLDDLLELGAIDIDPPLPLLGQSLDLIRQINASERPEGQ